MLGLSMSNGFKKAFNSSSVSLLLIVLFVNISLLNACYITNCPWGGKRSVGENDHEIRQCRKCANGLGTCFGPRICCGPNIGCLMDSQASLSCRLEDLRSTRPCVPYGKSCGKIEYGKCATKSLCCSADGCVHDASCSANDDEEVDLSDESIKSLLLDKSRRE